MSVLSPMFATQFKLTKPGELTRRITFPEPPTWSSLAHKIESIYGIPQEQVAVSYVDKDKDEITLNSNDELLDFFINCHQRGELVKFNIVDLGSVRAARSGTAATTKNVQDGSDLGNINLDLGTGATAVPPGMLFDDIFGAPTFHVFPQQPDHAFVEVIDDDDDDDGDYKGHEPVAGAARNLFQDMFNGKGKAANEENDKDTNSSSASIFDNEMPHKPLVHVYDLGHNGDQPPPPILLASPRTPKAELRASLRPSPMIPPVEPVSVPFEWINRPEPNYPAIDVEIPPLNSVRSTGKPLPKTPSVQTQRTSNIYSPPPVIITIPESPSSDTTFPPLRTATPPVVVVHDSQTSYTPKFGEHTFSDPPITTIYPDPVQRPTAFDERNAPNQYPSLAKDVAELIDVFSSVVSVHPDVTNKVRSIVRNAASGVYWSPDTVNNSNANATQSVHNAGTGSSRPSQRNLDNNRDVEYVAAEKIAAAVKGIFSTIREAVNGINEFSNPPNARENNSTERTNLNSHFGGATSGNTRPPEAPSITPARPPTAWPFVGIAPPPPPMIVPPPPMLNSPLLSRPAPFIPGRNVGMQQPLYAEPFIRSGAVPNSYARGIPHQPVNPHGFTPGYAAGTSDPYRNLHLVPNQQTNMKDDELKSDPHEKKAQLEAAKSIYRAEKEKFRKEKEERRKKRREMEDRRLEGNKASRAVEETVVARIPLGKSPEKRMGPFYAEVYSVSRPSQARDTSINNERPAPKPLSKSTSKGPLETAVLARLDDMGFRTSAYPDILVLLRAYMQINSEPTKENEDSIVTRIIQVLLTHD